VREIRVRRAIDSRIKDLGTCTSMRYGGALVTAFVGCFGDSSVVFELLDVERAHLGPLVSQAG